MRLAEAAGAKVRGMVPGGMVAVGAGTAVNAAACYLQLSLSGRSLDVRDGACFSVLWAITLSVGTGLFFPVEQEVTRAAAVRTARGLGPGPVLRRGAVLALGLLGATWAVLAVGAGPLAAALFDGRTGLVAALGGALGALAVTHWTRGALAGTRLFGCYGAQLALESVLRVALSSALAAAGCRSPLWFAAVLVAAPVVSALPFLALVVRRSGAWQGAGPAAPGRGTGALLLASLLAQALANAPVVTVRLLAPHAAALASALLYALVLVRIPQFLVAAVQASLLESLTRAHTEGDRAAFRRRLAAAAAAVGGLGLGWSLLCVLAGPALTVALFGAAPLLGPLDFAVLSLGNIGYLAAFLLGSATVAADRRAAQVGGWAAGTALLATAWIWPGPPQTGVALAYLCASWATVLLTLALWHMNSRNVDTPPRVSCGWSSGK